jgi:predicted ribosome quality control (RQC) complex YloA/Tae2 family protein
VAAGLSPLAAREAVARAAGAPDIAAPKIDSWDSVAAALRGLIAPVETGAWEPSIAWEDGTPLAFAPYRLTQFPDADVRPYPTMSAVLAATTDRPAAVPFERLKRPLLKALQDRMEQTRRKRSSLERSLASADRADELRVAGETILAHARTIDEGATALNVDGKRIDLYPTLSAVENAQAYFREYANARDAKRTVPPLLETVEAELQYLDEMMLHAQLAGTETEISALRRELETAGVIRSAKAAKQQPRKPAERPGGPYRRVTIDGADLLVGLSALGNETVTFRLAQPEDLWFHVRGVPGAHVILRGHGQHPSEAAIIAAAQVAGARSADRDAVRVEVDYTQRKYVRKLRGSTPGRVSYRNESTVAVAPASGEL